MAECGGWIASGWAASCARYSSQTSDERRCSAARADASSGRHRREASSLASAFLQWHLERGVRSLRLVDRRDPDRPETNPAITWSAPPPVEAAPVERVAQAHAALAGRTGEA